MTITVMNDYLVFPVYTHATEKRVDFLYKGKTVYRLNLKLDHASPDFYAYIDVSRFKGKDLELSVEPEMEFSCWEADELDIGNVYREANRPQIHFSVKNGFLGKPSALIYKDGIYHMFYHYHPGALEDGDFHLGHATSKDLIHWQEEKIAAFPDGKGFTDVHAVKEILECDEESEFFALADSDGNKKWISMDETGIYLIGSIKNGKFQSEQAEQALYYGNTAHAGKNFCGLQDGRTVRMDQTAWHAPRSRFCGQMGIPTELSLKKEGEFYYLQALPVDEIEALYKNTNRYENIKAQKGKTIEIPIADAAQMIHIKGGFAEDAVLDMILFGRKVRIDFSENQIQIGKSKAPASVAKKTLDLVILVDRCGMELFADGGKICFSSTEEAAMMDRNLLNLKICCNAEYSMHLLEIHSLESIWQNSPKKY